jgi:hypothetical protein
MARIRFGSLGNHSSHIRSTRSHNVSHVFSKLEGRCSGINSLPFAISRKSLAVDIASPQGRIYRAVNCAWLSCGSAIQLVADYPGSSSFVIRNSVYVRHGEFLHHKNHFLEVSHASVLSPTMSKELALLCIFTFIFCRSWMRGASFWRKRAVMFCWFLKLSLIRLLVAFVFVAEIQAKVRC